MARCRCHSGKTYKRCCRPWHDGRPTPDPETLMRSRYCAYAHGLTAYILATTAPESPHVQRDRAKWEADVVRFCAQSGFVGLKVHAADAEGDQGRVHFTARLVQNGREVLLEERSRFVRRNGQWFYVEAVESM